MEKRERVFRDRKLNAEEIERDRLVLETFASRPGQDELIASGEIDQPVPHAYYLTMLELAPQLRRAREEQGLALADLSERVGIDRAALSRLETGQSENPTVLTLERVAVGLGKRLRFFLEDIPTGQTPAST